MEAIRFETAVGKGGIVTVPEVEPGERVEVIIFKLGANIKPKRRGGWAEGRVRILPTFDDPIPGMGNPPSMRPGTTAFERRCDLI